jgi:hypothetical protein
MGEMRFMEIQRDKLRFIENHRNYGIRHLQITNSNSSFMIFCTSKENAVDEL